MAKKYFVNKKCYAGKLFQKNQIVEATDISVSPIPRHFIPVDTRRDLTTTLREAEKEIAEKQAEMRAAGVSGYYNINLSDEENGLPKKPGRKSKKEESQEEAPEE